MQESVEQLRRSLIEKHAAFRQVFVELFHDLVSSSEQNKEQRILQTRESVALIWSLLADRDRPQWLKSLMDLLSRPRSAFPYGNLIDAIMPLRETAMNHQWVFSEGVEDSIDFDEVFERHRKESKLGELFDEVVNIMTRIIEAQGMDSRVIEAVLRRLILLIQKNRNGSFSALPTWLKFIIGVLKNFVIEELRSIPVLGPLVTALEKTFEEIQDEVSIVMTKSYHELETSVISIVPDILYTRSGSTLSVLQSTQPTLNQMG
ncbi:hypothetical protein [Geothrix sp. 21YS21S-2]|uniref:hypothetical protein n=1 Tax=Geothrix sp. 21YS21S-2 TaxID=3068893 RepID=UPI0027BA7AE8|nr:hypothetical protein [Geothrix sp. 21YS21S-2]